MTEKFSRQAQLYDHVAMKPCRHTMLCEKHDRCVSSTAKKACPYRCQICAPREAQHA